MRPDVGIGWNHIFKRKNFTAFVFVCNTNPDSVLFGFAVFKNTVTELCMVGSAHFVDIEKNYPVTDSIVIKIKYISYNTEVAGNNIAELGTADTAAKTEVVILKDKLLNFSKYNKA